ERVVLVRGADRADRERGGRADPPRRRRRGPQPAPARARAARALTQGQADASERPAGGGPGAEIDSSRCTSWPCESSIRRSSRYVVPGTKRKRVVTGTHPRGLPPPTPSPHAARLYATPRCAPASRCERSSSAGTRKSCTRLVGSALTRRSRAAGSEAAAKRASDGFARPLLSSRPLCHG